MTKRWTEGAAKAWYEKMPWLIGCNYAPRNAINQLEMWQKETFAPVVIREELSWAKSLGFNTIRVFFHDLLWQQDAKGFLRRMDQVFDIAKRQGIRVMPVFFDSVWHPFPHIGKQNDPEPGVHNSGWVQSPGVHILRDENRFMDLEGYVTEIVRHFRNDDRVVIWDLWNEPDNGNGPSYGSRDLGEGKGALVAGLLPHVFQWARKAKPSQPMTTAIWLGDWTTQDTLKPHEKVQLELSDIVSFHNYGPAEDTERRIQLLKRYNRPIVCTEYMSRGTGSTFESVLPVLKQHNVGAYNWGFVQGKTQTHIPWDSWQWPYEKEPDPWFHEIFRNDGSPYRQEEVTLIRSLTGVQAPPIARRTAKKVVKRVAAKRKTSKK